MVFAAAFICAASVLPPAVKAAPAAGKTAKQEVNLKSDRGDYNDKEKLVRLIGNVVFTCGQTSMRSSFAQYHTDTQIADFQGSIKLEQPGTSVTGKSMRVYYASQKAILKGGVSVVSDRLRTAESGSVNGGASDRMPAYLDADEFVYNWGDGTGTAKGRIKFRQGERRIYADKADYDSKSDTVELSGGVRFEQSKGDWLAGQRVKVNLASNTVQASGQVMGRFLIEGEPVPQASEKDEFLPEPETLEPDPKSSPSSEERVNSVKYPDI